MKRSSAIGALALASPLNKLGQVTVFQTGRHGAGDGANAPGFIGPGQDVRCRTCG